MSKRSMLFLGIGGLFIIAAGIFMLQQSQRLEIAHSTFENYYAFRGCTQLISRSEEAGTCITDSGQTIKIVKFRDKWYLDGDLPWGCIGNFCYGL